MSGERQAKACPTGRGYTRWQATQCSPAAVPTLRQSGMRVLHSSMAMGQRVLKTLPEIPLPDLTELSELAQQLRNS